MRVTRAPSPPGSIFRRALVAGAAGTVAITISTNVEMRIRGRGPSEAPIDALERIAGRRLPARKALGGAAHLASGLALGLPRVLIERGGVREPVATLLFLPIAWSPDLAAVPALGAAEPPWRWGWTETGVSLIHHVAYATAAGAALAALDRSPAE
jgi:hypothetical protein